MTDKPDTAKLRELLARDVTVAKVARSVVAQVYIPTLEQVLDRRLCI